MCIRDSNWSDGAAEVCKGKVRRFKLKDFFGKGKGLFATPTITGKPGQAFMALVHKVVEEVAAERSSKDTGVCAKELTEYLTPSKAKKQDG
eukprot:1430710-Prorocentrum_lima.AAC.1